MPIFYDPIRNEWFCYCNECAKEERTREALQNQGWVEVQLDLEDPRRQEEGLWYCQGCGQLLDDVPPICFL
jgi:hypothetical protein